MRWELVRPGVVRLTYSNGAFAGEYGYEGVKMLRTVTRGGTAEFDLAQIEAKAREMVAKGVTSAVVDG